MTYNVLGMKGQEIESGTQHDIHYAGIEVAGYYIRNIKYPALCWC
jgi:hypothetical protein